MATRKKKRVRKPATKRDSFRWDCHKEEAAQLLAENDFTVDEIAAKVGVDRATIFRWKDKAEFAARIAELEQRLGDLSLRRVIARRGRRLLALEDRWLRMQRVIEERAVAPHLQDAPGGKTGLVVREQKMIGKGDNAMLIEEFSVDLGLLKELREHEKQAAMELGQWVEKHAPTTPDGNETYSGFPAMDLDEFRKLPIAERIRLLRAPVRAYPVDRAEQSPAT